MKRLAFYFPGYAASRPQIILRDPHRAAVLTGATGRELPPVAPRSRHGGRAGLRRGHRRPVGLPGRSAGGGPGATTGSYTRNRQPDPLPVATGRLREHPAISVDFSDRRRATAGGGMQTTA